MDGAGNGAPQQARRAPSRIRNFAIESIHKRSHAECPKCPRNCPKSPKRVPDGHAVVD